MNHYDTLVASLKRKGYILVEKSSGWYYTISKPKTGYHTTLASVGAVDAFLKGIESTED